MKTSFSCEAQGMTPVLLLLLAAASAQLLQDSPYTEIVSERRPLAGLWAPGQVPTGWRPLPHSNYKELVIANLREAQAVMALGEDGVLDLMNGDAHFPLVGAGEPVRRIAAVPGGTFSSSVSFLALSERTVYKATCNQSMVTCELSALVAHAAGVPTAALFYPVDSAVGVAGYLWVLGEGGTQAFALPPNSAPSLVKVVFSSASTYAAIAHSARQDELALGNSSVVLYLSPFPPFTFQYFDWVTYIDPTNPANAKGAPIDGSVTALVYARSERGDILYAGNSVCLNMRLPGTLEWLRLAGEEGLPYGNITALVLDARADNSQSPKLWLGTEAGVSLFDPVAPAPSRSYASRRLQATLKLNRSRRSAVVHLEQRWRYFYGPRWLPGSPSNVFEAPVTSMVSLGNSTFVLTGAGVATLRAEDWTLSKKAAHFESLLSNHDRLGLVAECSLGSFGVTNPCTQGPSDNNGLWTSLVVNAFAFKHRITQEQADWDRAWHFLQGLKLLNDVTGIKGLMARSAVAPGTPFPGQDWHNSTSMPGYAFEGTASSDEVVGHLFAYATLLTVGFPDNNATARETIVELLVNIASYIVSNNFTLVDITGQPTEWGHWEPATLNVNRDWSDGRGINSFEIVALISAALPYVAEGSPQQLLLNRGLEELVRAGYLRNLINARVNAPCDENFSDDELEWFSYFAGLLSAGDVVKEPMLLSVERSWYTGVKRQRSSLWGAMYIAMRSPGFPKPPRPVSGQHHAAASRTDTVPPSSSPAGTAELSKPQDLVLKLRRRLDQGQVPTSKARRSELHSIAQDVLFNLRTWSLELTTWPANNSHRVDLAVAPGANRVGVFGTDSTRLVPQNERCQDRWNSDPFNLQCGSGHSEQDPGAWLLPYWLARYYGIISG